MSKLTSDYQVVIRPKQPWLHFDWRGLVQYRDLLVLMVLRDFTAKYKQTLLGPLWFIINPLINAVVFTLVFAKMLNVSTETVPPMLFFLSSQLAWNYFSSVLGSTGNSLAGNAHLFGKVYFPRLIPPLAMCGSCLIAFFVQLGVFLVAWAYYKFATDRGMNFQMSWEIALLPLVLLQMASLGLGVGLLLSSITAKYRDLVQLTGFLVQVWMYASPVLYPLSSMPKHWQLLANVNPMTSIIEFMRHMFLGVGTYTAAGYASSVIITVVILISGVLFYQRMARTFVDTV